MAQVRNISGEPRQVPELGGFGGGRVVDVDEVVDVPDDRYAGFVSQEDTWEGVVEPIGQVTDPTISPPPPHEDDADPDTFVVDTDQLVGSGGDQHTDEQHDGSDS